MRFKKFLINQTLLIIVIFTFIILSATSKYFLSINNILTILGQISVIGVAAIGATIILIGRGLDLSVPGVMLFSSVAGGLLIVNYGINPVIGIGAILLVGAIVGAINGFFISYLKMVPFIVTLALWQIGKGASNIATGVKTVAGLPFIFNFIGIGRIAGIPVLIYILIIFYLIFYFILRNTTFGRSIYLVGSNIKAAEISGINVKRILFLTYLIGGFLSALGGFLLTCRLNSVSMGQADRLLLDVLGATIVGGTSLAGGVGSLYGTFLGVFLFGILNNGLNLYGVEIDYQLVIKGIIIISAVFIDRRRRQNV